MYKGTVFDETKEKTTVVAIKTLKERNAKIEFFKGSRNILRAENCVALVALLYFDTMPKC